jgi:hypothetical protein
MSVTVEEITTIANDKRLKPGPKAGLIWAKVNFTRPPAGMQLVKGMGVCRNAAEGWLRAWERYGYLFRLPSQASDGKWTWRRFFPEHTTDAQKVSIKGSTRSSTKRTISRNGHSSSTTHVPSENEVLREIVVNAQKVSIGATREDEPEPDLEQAKQWADRLVAALSTGR